MVADIATHLWSPWEKIFFLSRERNEMNRRLCLAIFIRALSRLEQRLPSGAQLSMTEISVISSLLKGYSPRPSSVIYGTPDILTVKELLRLPQLHQEKKSFVEELSKRAAAATDPLRPVWACHVVESSKLFPVRVSCLVRLCCLTDSLIICACRMAVPC